MAEKTPTEKRVQELKRARIRMRKLYGQHEHAKCVQLLRMQFEHTGVFDERWSEALAILLWREGVASDPNQRELALARALLPDLGRRRVWEVVEGWRLACAHAFPPDKTARRIQQAGGLPAFVKSKQDTRTRFRRSQLKRRRKSPGEGAQGATED